jgi:hypothetical protein
MKYKLHFCVCAAGLLLCTGIGFAFQKQIAESFQRHRLERNVADLRSGDFHANRRAQAEIVSAGKPALPLLFDTINSSKDSDQISLCCYLIGQIDGESYASALTRFAVPGKFCVILCYPNRAAINKLSHERKEDLLSHFRKLDTQASKEESACVRNFLEFNSTN